MKIVWFCVLFSLLSTAAYTGISGALSGAGQPLSDAPASTGTTLPSLDTPGEVIALDTSSGRRAAGSAGNGNKPATADLSDYLFLHKTRNEHTPPRTTAEVNACPE
jgi:hypothetical protein